MRCPCKVSNHPGRLVVLTGGPGAGKTAVLEVVRRQFCEHVAVLPESASILFAGGFPRRSGEEARRAAQRAIFHVQTELERIVLADGVAVALCDRGTVDSLAYWPGTPEELWSQVGSTLATEVARYAAVIHLRTPAAEHYNHRNPVRIESAAEAALLDERIAAVWRDHPRRFFVDGTPDFFEKLTRAVALIEKEVPACCRGAVRA